jgi:hypothetical protein
VACAEGPIPCEVARVTGPTDNVAITAFAARRYPYARDKIEVLTEVRNLGDTPAKVVLEVEADDAMVGRRTLRLEPGQSKREVLAQLDAARSRFEARLTREDGSSETLGLSPQVRSIGAEFDVGPKCLYPGRRACFTYPP